MANALYDSGRQKFLEGGIAWLTDNIKAMLVTAGYTPNLATDVFVNPAIAAGNQVAISANLTTKTSTAGVADSDDVTFPTVSGSAVKAIVLFKDTGSQATSPLIAYIDTATGLPVTPSGGDILVVWDNGSNRIFKL